MKLATIVYADIASIYIITIPNNINPVPHLRAIPKSDMLTSWIHTTVLLRNMCAHNSRIYNRSLSLKPVLLHADQQTPIPKYCGLYHFMMAVKYLRPSDASWIVFMEKFHSSPLFIAPNLTNTGYFCT